MAFVAGIDEAGFGPLLGPLVVSGVAFELPAELVGADLWRALRPAVTKTIRKRHSGIAVGDSKKLYKPDLGIEQLERGVLGMFSTLTDRTASLRGLLGLLSPAVPALMEQYPWYRGLDVPLPLRAEAAGLRIRSRVVAAAMADAQMRLAAIRCEVLHVGQFNALVRSTDNKATTLLDQTCRLIDWFWQHGCGGENLTVLVDRQGGRQHYLRVLQRLYESAAVKILAEQEEYSAYRLTMGPRVLEVHFMVQGENAHLPIALASMTSKYLRELFMHLENGYWRGQLAAGSLKPTAGYYLDGKRFLADIAEACERLNTPMDLLVRNR
jgi:ribonuclease HII